MAASLRCAVERHRRGRPQPAYRWVPAVRVDRCRPDAARVVRRGLREPRAGGERGPVRQPVGMVGRPGLPARRRHRIASGQRAGRRGVRRSARRDQRTGRRGLPAGQRVPAGPADRSGELRRRGGSPIRSRLRRVAGDHRRDDGRASAGSYRRRRASRWPPRCAGPGDGPIPSAATTRRWLGSAASSSCMSSRAAAWSISIGRWAWPATSGPMGGGGSTSPVRPTMPGPPEWPTAAMRCSAPRR